MENTKRQRFVIKFFFTVLALVIITFSYAFNWHKYTDNVTFRNHTQYTINVWPTMVAAPTRTVTLLPHHHHKFINISGEYLSTIEVNIYDKNTQKYALYDCVLPSYFPSLVHKNATYDIFNHSPADQSLSELKLVAEYHFTGVWGARKVFKASCNFEGWSNYAS